MPLWKHLQCGTVFPGSVPPFHCDVCGTAELTTGWAHVGNAPSGTAIKKARYGKSTHSPLKRERVYARDGNRCVECGSGDDLTLDHILPKSKGGTNHAANLQTLCQPCNQAKGSST